jgi:hypothetical protein
MVQFQQMDYYQVGVAESMYARIIPTAVTLTDSYSQLEKKVNTTHEVFGQPLLKNGAVSPLTASTPPVEPLPNLRRL